MLLTDALNSFKAAKPCLTSSEFFTSSLNSAELGSRTSENVLPQKLVVVGAAMAGAMGLAHKRNANMPDIYKKQHAKDLITWCKNDFSCRHIIYVTHQLQLCQRYCFSWIMKISTPCYIGSIQELETLPLLLPTNIPKERLLRPSFLFFKCVESDEPTQIKSFLQSSFFPGSMTHVYFLSTPQ